MKERKFYCPECGTELEYAYNREDGTPVYYCPEGDEHYYFQEQNGYLYAVCLWDGGKVCMGTE